MFSLVSTEMVLELKGCFLCSVCGL